MHLTTKIQIQYSVQNKLFSFLNGVVLFSLRLHPQLYIAVLKHITVATSTPGVHTS